MLIMFGFFRKKAEKDEVDQLKNAVQSGFNSVKHDIGSLSKWIKHLDANDSKIDEQISGFSDDLATVKEDLENVKNMLSILGERRVFKQASTVFNKQTPVDGVLNTVQTGVQTAFLGNLTTNERAIIFVLMNSDMKLSYEDLAAMLGKRKSTIRGQVNSIRQKGEGLIEEVIGENNKKRVFIPDKIKEMLVKSGTVGKRGKSRKSEG